MMPTEADHRIVDTLSEVTKSSAELNVIGINII